MPELKMQHMLRGVVRSSLEQHTAEPGSRIRFTVGDLRTTIEYVVRNFAKHSESTTLIALEHLAPEIGKILDDALQAVKEKFEAEKQSF